jgi:NAD(P)-dependent dehydrogenase (short-subunit alcohol dehydrogenase family)
MTKATPATALVIGNSDGIGLGLTRALLARGWSVVGISRSPTPIEDPAYHHHVIKVQDPAYPPLLRTIMDQRGVPEVCVFCAGIGCTLDVARMDGDRRVFEVNLLAMVDTLAQVIPRMVERGGGHFVGLSSLADQFIVADAPSYCASKAAVTGYLEGVALAARPMGVAVTNVRFGFVDTKMATGDVRPLMITVDHAVDHLLHCLRRRPIRYTAPKLAIPLAVLARVALRLKAAWSGRAGRTRTRE